MHVNAQRLAEYPSGCFWQSDRGHCTVFNDTLKPVACNVVVKTTDTNGESKIISKKLIVPAKMDSEFKMSIDEKIERVQVRAICK